MLFVELITRPSIDSCRLSFGDHHPSTTGRVCRHDTDLANRKIVPVGDNRPDGAGCSIASTRAASPRTTPLTAVLESGGRLNSPHEFDYPVASNGTLIKRLSLEFVDSRSGLGRQTEKAPIQPRRSLPAAIFDRRTAARRRISSARRTTQSAARVPVTEGITRRTDDESNSFETFVADASVTEIEPSATGGKAGHRLDLPVCRTIAERSAM